MVVLGRCGGKTRGREHMDVAVAKFVHAGSHGCAQSTRAHNALQSCAPVAFRFGGFLLGHEHMLFLLHKMRVWN